MNEDEDEERAFYYINGRPTVGVWIDLTTDVSEDDILEALAAANLIPRDEDGDPDYGGDLLVACTEGDIAPHFLSKYDTFDLDGFMECLVEVETLGAKKAAVAAYLGDRGSWSKSDFEDAYAGEYESEKAYAEELFDECYAHDIPENMRCYIDYEKFARYLFMGDYTFIDGYVFRSC